MGVALSFLRNFGILSGASGVLGALSSGVASAALDDRFAVQRAQQKQVSALWMCTARQCSPKALIRIRLDKSGMLMTRCMLK